METSVKTRVLDPRISAFRKLSFLTGSICMLLLLCSRAFAGGGEDIHVLKISPQDGRAVVKTPDGNMKVIKAGDVLRVASERVAGEKGQKSVAGDELRVVEIAEGRVVFEEKKGDETETVIIRLADGKQKIERIRKTEEKRPELLAPQSVQEPRADEKSRLGRKKESSFD